MSRNRVDPLTKYLNTKCIASGEKWWAAEHTIDCPNCGARITMTFGKVPDHYPSNYAADIAKYRGTR